MTNNLEFYETPRTFSRYLFTELEALGFPVCGRTFEPCVGSHAIVDAYLEYVRDRLVALDVPDLAAWSTNDLDPRWPAMHHLDATTLACWVEASRSSWVDWTVSNPPFTPALEIIEHALAYSRLGVAMHLRASIHEVLKTGTRRTWFQEHPPSGILWLPRFAYQRSKTTGKWTTDSVCACWVVWLKGTDHQFIRYAPESVLEQLEEETPAFRARMDALMREEGPCPTTCRTPSGATPPAPGSPSPSSTTPR